MIEITLMADVGQHAMRVGRNVPLQPVEVSHFGGCGGDHQIVVFGQPDNGEIRLDAAPGVQPLGVDDAARTHVHVVGADVVQHPGASAP